MAKFKLTLSRLPDFNLPVTFTMADGREASIVFKVKHKKPDEVKALFDKEISNFDFISEIATGWDLEDEFNAENVKELTDLFMAVAGEFVSEYMKALAGQRTKN